MRISLRTQGGFSGPAGAVVRTLDTEALPPASRAKLLELVREAGVFGHEPKAMLARPRPQDFKYQLDVDDGGRSHQLDFHRAAVAEPMQKLVDWLEDEVEPKSAFKP